MLVECKIEDIDFFNIINRSNSLLSNFDYTEIDRSFYEKHIKSRIPPRIFDVHVHINLEEHIAMVPEERWYSDWALECGHLLPCDDAHSIAKELFPDSRYEIAGFPWPINEADLAGNNQYLAKMGAEGKLKPFMCVKPEWEPDYIERTLVEGGFVGFKPYPDMVTDVKGADISIFGFLPHEQCKILDRYGKAVMLHLPRKERIADRDNIRELLELRQRYPNITIIIAHFGRSFCPIYLRKGLKRMGDVRGFYFDTSAVINPEVYDVALDFIDPSKILFGTDMPITLWHGKQKWRRKRYINIPREEFTWKKLRKPKEEPFYNLILYEQVRSILDAFERNRLGKEEKEGIFYGNAIRALKL